MDNEVESKGGVDPGDREAAQLGARVAAMNVSVSPTGLPNDISYIIIKWISERPAGLLVPEIRALSLSKPTWLNINWWIVLER